MPLAPPAFQFYAGDFLVSTTTLSNAQVGAYIRLLSHQWVNGGVPPDVRLLSKIVHESEKKTRVLFDGLRSKFELYTDGLLKNPRLEEVRRNAAEFRELQSAKGRQGGLAKARNALAGAKPSRLQPKRSSSIFDLRSSVRTESTRLPPHTPSQAVEKSRSRERPKVRVLAAMCLADILPLGIPDGPERVEAAKRRAASLHLRYDSWSIGRALASASGQLAKRMNGHDR